MKLIGLHGLPRSGKDSIAKILIRTKGFTRLAFADPLKQAAAVLLDRPLAHCNGEEFDREAKMPEWGFSMRWFLQVFGTECLRQQVRDDFWVKRMEVEFDRQFRAAEALRQECRMVITDVRFENEMALIRSYGGKVVQVLRPGLVASNHVSDQSLACDGVIHNDGTINELQLKAELLVTSKYLWIS